MMLSAIFMLFGFRADAMTSDEITAKISSVSSAMNGYYWNANKTETELISAVNSGNYGYGLTSYACSLSINDENYHLTEYGCSSNTFNDRRQCAGFAHYMGYVVFGSKPSAENGWKLLYSVDSLQPGDIVRYNGHSLMVWYISGDKLYVAEANWWNNQKRWCQVHFGAFWDSASTVLNGLSNVWRNTNAGSVNQAPSGAWMSTYSLTVESGEPITLAFNANNATGFGIGIDRNGSRVYYHDNGNNNYHTVTFTEPGSYSAYVSAYNSAGAWNDSNKVYFSVTPKKHKVSYNTDGGTVANGPKASFDFHGFNRFRDVEQMVIYTTSYGASTGTNIYGNEYIVDANNQVIQIIEHTGNATIPAGGFVVSALDGTPASFCYSNISVGDYINYDPDEMRLFVWSAEAWNAGMKTRVVDGVNVYRDENQLILYDTNRGYTTTMTNEWGIENAISDRNQVTASESTGGNMEIPVGGYVLSGHLAGADWLYYNIQADDYVVYDSYLGKLYVWEKDAWIAGNKLVYEGETYGALPTPTKEGYNFLGWQNASGEIVTADTRVTETQDHTLTATWKQQGYVVSFYMNGAYNEEYYTPITVPADEDFVLPDEPTKFGSRFLGWGTSQVDIFPAYQAGSVYTDRKDITFYAIWQAEIYAECEMTEYINYFLCDLTFFNRATDFKLYIAKYKDEKFVGVESSIVTGDTASFILLKSEGVDEIRLFFWNTDGSLEPFGNTFTIYPYYSDL